VAANIAALDAQFVGEVNIGTGVETNVLEIFRHLREALGSTTEAQHGPAKPGEQRRSCINAERALRVLGWHPQVPLVEGLRRTAAWYRNSISP
jgi:UDP-glucose 4-epimerase